MRWAMRSMRAWSSCGVGGGAAKVQRCLAGRLEAVDAVEGEDVEVEVQVHGAAEALDEGDRAGAGGTLVEMGAADQMGGETAVHDAQDFTQGPSVGGAQEPQRDGEREHPLAQRQRRQYLIDEQRGALDHAPRAAGGAEAAPLTAEGDELFVMAHFAAHAHEAVLEAAAFQACLEFATHVGRQCPTLGGKVLEEGGVVALHRLVQDGGLGAVAERCRSQAIAACPVEIP